RRRGEGGFGRDRRPPGGSFEASARPGRRADRDRRRAGASTWPESLRAIRHHRAVRGVHDGPSEEAPLLSSGGSGRAPYHPFSSLLFFSSFPLRPGVREGSTHPGRKARMMTEGAATRKRVERRSAVPIKPKRASAREDQQPAAHSARESSVGSNPQLSIPGGGGVSPPRKRCERRKTASVRSIVPSSFTSAASGHRAGSPPRKS